MGSSWKADKARRDKARLREGGGVVRGVDDNTVMYYIKEEVWPSGQHVGLAMRWSRVQVLLSGYLLDLFSVIRS